MRYTLGGWAIGFSIGFVLAAFITYLFAKHDSIVLEYMYNGNMFRYMISNIPSFIGMGCLISICGFFVGYCIRVSLENEKKYDRYKEHFGIDYPEKD